MNRIAWPTAIVAVGLLLALFATLAATGCSREAKTEELTRAVEPLSVRVTQPKKRDIVRVVGQPSFVESYERTSIYPKLSAYIKKWYADIGDKVKKNQVLADLFVPEVEEDCQTKFEAVEWAEERVRLVEEKVRVAEANVKVAAAGLKAAQEILDQYESQVTRWEKEVSRLVREAHGGHVDRRILRESQSQLKASSSARDAALAEIERAEADLASKTAKFDEEEVAVQVAQAAPIYVIERTDVLRIFVDIPEHSANYVKVGSKGSVLVKAFRDQPLIGTVTRTSWALQVDSRTLRAEIDLPNVGSAIPDDVPPVVRDAISNVKLPNTESQILPGMYGVAKVIIERPHVHALPKAALFTIGERTYCYLCEKGKAVRIEVQTGLSDTKNKWVEVTNRRRVQTSDTLHNTSYPVTTQLVNQDVDKPQLDDAGWLRFDGSEEIIIGDLSILSDGEPVHVGAAVVENKRGVAEEQHGV